MHAKATRDSVTTSELIISYSGGKLRAFRNGKFRGRVFRLGHIDIIATSAKITSGEDGTSVVGEGGDREESKRKQGVTADTNILLIWQTSTSASKSASKTIVGWYLRIMQVTRCLASFSETIASRRIAGTPISCPKFQHQLEMQ